MPRIAHPAFAVPGAMDSLIALSKASKAVPGLPLALLELMHLRASQINGDGNNVNLHPRLARAAGETSEDRIISVASWRNTPWFTEPERAALALTEAVTRLDDRADPVPDEIWEPARRHYDEPVLAAMVLSLGLVNLWNRLHVATGQVFDPAR